ncbi:16S rRNA (guanine(966)-N(2))-methyltransferase RsmD [Gammaproteobacteria bacterium 53_120_T64]|nr:16S rRNA (guanine(966)-N(2))-methyltransferase RsmD [Gammaproteobacteria bacterium 53_120_T64]
MSRKASHQQETGQVRIIAGQCRGRRITFPAVAGLRPTGDRLRETLFNWLATELRGARCLDLFAGSGALGLEAASRGASEVILLELNNSAARALGDNIELLKLTSATALNDSALNWLQHYPRDNKPFDIIFLDPPFDSPLLNETLDILAQQLHLLAPEAMIYIEAPARQTMDAIPTNWQLQRQKTAGNVGYYLFRKQASPAPDQPERAFNPSN